MRRYLILLLILIVPAWIFAGTTGKITGVITDKKTGEPLPGVNVILDGTTYGAATDVDGVYFILNVPPGTYVLKAIYLGYKTVEVKNVRVMADLTTRIDVQMEEVPIEYGEEVVVVAKRPLIQKDLTASRTIATSEEIKAIPFENVQDIVNITPGFVAGHARGGRAGEVLYQIDGVTTMDPMYNSFDTDVPEFAVEEVSVITGGFSTEYGNAQSGVINMVIKEGGPKYSGSFRYKTSDFGKNSSWTDSHALQNFEFSFGGPEPITHFLNFYRGKLRFFVAGEWRKDNGRFEHNYSKEFSIQTKFTWTPSTKHKITFSYLGTLGDYGDWGILWSRPTNEDRNLLMPQNVDPTLSNYVEDPGADSIIVTWWGNGRLDTEDLNHNGVLDPGEDLNGNGRIDSEDLNHNGKLDVFNMLDHLPYYHTSTDNFIFNWVYQIGAKSFLEAKFSRYRTSMKYNVKENINEDTDGDGHLDLYYDANGDGVPEDVDGDGDNRMEDLNGNLQWDWKRDGGNTDLFTDNNNNGYIDASEWRPRDQWISWNDVPIGNSKDNDGYYNYGTGFTYSRLRWNFDQKFTYTGKVTFYSQVDKYNEIKTGAEYNYYDIFDFDRDLASGGNVYGQRIDHVKPYSFAAFFEDKMEYGGMILNAGIRVDYFNSNTTFPADPNDPVEEGEGKVKNPVKTRDHWYVSPRFGISHPITERDVLYYNYGRYFQIPRFIFLYRNLTFDLSGAFPIVGNPNIDPETTTSYEIGLKHQFTRDLKIEVKGFYKDIRGLTDTKSVYYTVANYYTIYQNLDYGNVRGFEVQLYKRMGRFLTRYLNVGGTINYTYSIAKGKSSSAHQNYIYTWAQNIIPAEENFLDWDQRHTMNANINIRIPQGSHLLHGFLDDMGVDLVFRYGSGLPYSSTARTRIPPINDKRRPPTYYLDMIFDKQVRIDNHYTLKFFLWANHLEDQWLNHRNVTRIADVQWYEQFGDPSGKYHDPSVYSEGTIWRLGVQVDF